MENDAVPRTLGIATSAEIHHLVSIRWLGNRGQCCICVCPSSLAVDCGAPEKCCPGSDNGREHASVTRLKVSKQTPGRAGLFLNDSSLLHDMVDGLV